MNALREGKEPPPVTDDVALGARALISAMALDPELYRAALEYVGTVTPIQQVLARPSVRAALSAARDMVKNARPPQIPGPNRQQLLEIVA